MAENDPGVVCIHPQRGFRPAVWIADSYALASQTEGAMMIHQNGYCDDSSGHWSFRRTYHA